MRDDEDSCGGSSILESQTNRHSIDMSGPDKLWADACCAMQVVVPFLGQVMSEEEATAVSKEFTERCYQEIREKPKEELEDNEGEDLCNAEFSLAYGESRCLVPDNTCQPGSLLRQRAGLSALHTRKGVPYC